MISIKDVEILDILPYTLKTDEYKALSKAIAELTAYFYDTMSSVLFWGDIDNASPDLLDAMAAELDAPFYSSDLPDDQKRAIISAAFVYNSRIGTVSSITGLLAAAFGGGEVREWFEYDGEPYHFKAVIDNSLSLDINKKGYEVLKQKLNAVKPVRAKMDAVQLINSETMSYYTGIGRYTALKINVGCEIPDMDIVYLADATGEILTDELGNKLIL